MHFLRGPLSRRLSVLAFAVALAACGGGGSDSAAPAAPAATPVTPPVVETPAKPDTITITPACTGSDCAAVDETTYSGSGVGVWVRSNTSGAAMDVPVQISGLDSAVGQNVTLLLTNESGVAQPLSNISLSASRSPSVMRSVAAVANGNDAVEARKRRIAEYNHAAAKRLGGSAKSFVSRSVQVAPPLAAGATRDWFDDKGAVRSTELMWSTNAADGRLVNIWVEDGEFDPLKINNTILNSLSNAFAAPGGIYDMLVDIGGPLWGAHGESVLIPPSAQPVDIVIVNFVPDTQPYGMLGYFWSKNNFVNDGVDVIGSNESLSMYLDAETLYLGGAAGMQSMLTTLAHEGMHMQNFYRRAVQHGDPYDIWLEEMTAMMMEDFVSFNIDPTHNAIRDVRFPDYLGNGKKGSYDCNLTDWQAITATCDSYAVAGSFGGFLDRHLGLAFYKDLLNRRGSDPVTVLNAAIQAASPGSSMAEQFRRWSVSSNSLMPGKSAPTGYGYPARTDGMYQMPRIDPGLFANIRALPTSVPALLEPYASFPIVREAVKGSFSETVRVPAGTTLSVIIH